MRGKLKALFVLGALAVTAWPSVGSAQEQNQIVVVPYSQRNPQLPHPAHEQARITLKAVVRNATCANANGYTVWWDANRNGNYDDDHAASYTRDGNLTLWDIGRTFLVPNVDRDTSLNINVRVRNNCLGVNDPNRDKFGTFRLFVYDFTPATDVRNWTAEQLEIMAAMGVQESLWYVHRSVTSRPGSDSFMTGVAGHVYANPLATWLFTINGHLPAYPPHHVQQVINKAGGVGNLPEGWVSANEARWNASPYAETVLRTANSLAARGATVGIAAGEESNQCGYNAQRQPITCPRVDAANGDNTGARANGSTNVYIHGMALGALPTVLPALAGTPVMNNVANIGAANRKWEWYVQQLVDQLGYAQIDGPAPDINRIEGGRNRDTRSGMGGWYYDTLQGNYSGSYSDSSTTQWAYIGFESAEIAGGPYGVFVNNRHKYRIANNLVNNQRADNAAGYRSTGVDYGDIKLTGGALVAARWLGIHTFAANDGTVPFPNESAYSRGRLRQAYDAYLSAISTQWTDTRATCRGHHWPDCLWDQGDYLCGTPNGVYNIEACGNSYTLYSLQKGFRTGQPEISIIGGRDWHRQFTTYYLRAQDRHANPNSPWENYSITGRIQDRCYGTTSVTCNYSGYHLNGAMGGLVLTPTIFNPKPVAIGSANPTEVTEGCAGGNSGRVTFNHSASFHPNADSRIVAYQWDVNAADNPIPGDINDPRNWADPDYVTDNPNEAIVHTYQRAGVYVATLRVVDNLGQFKTTQVTIRVNPAANVPPAAAHGGPYVIEVGQALQLRGSGTDANTGCGDTLTITWDLDNNGQFNDANGATPTVPWANLQNLPRNQAIPIRIRVRDAAGLEATAQTTLSIYPAEPIASGRANPNPAACEAAVTFDASASVHPNPNRTIAQYQWDVDGNAGFDGAGRIFSYTYQRYGTYQVRLRVTDDLGRSNETTFQVVVDQGNQPPVARTTAAEYSVLEGDALVLDGRPSTDPNTACGDSIAQYAWDLDGDGNFNGPNDVQGARVVIPWETVQQVLAGPADRNTGNPSNTVTLRVTDSFGRTSTVQVTVRWYLARPEAIVVQSPNPAPINLVTGFSNPSLDGRESRSPVPGATIAAYNWDLDDNGTFEIQNRPVVEFVKVFDPVPGPNDIPEVFVRLQVVDNTGRASEPRRYRVIYRVPPTPPTADADPTDPPEQAYHILLGEGLTLDASQSLDPDAAEFGDYIKFYRWDLTYREQDGFRADFTTQDDNGDKREARLELTAQQLAGVGLNAPGTYNIRLQVEDTTQLTNEDGSTITIYPVNPIARIDANPNPAACGARVTLDGSASAHGHPRIDVNGYAWDLDGDGEFDDAQGATIQHQFQQFTFNQPVRVGLQVTDTNGNRGTAFVDVNVNQGNRPPAAVGGGFRNGQGQVVGPYTIAVGEALNLNATGTTDPDAACGDQVVSYQWDIGNNGSFDAQGQQVQLTWQQLNQLGINAAGQYDVRMRATDRFGATGDALVTLNVVNGPRAVATASPDRAACQTQVEFNGSNSTTDGPEDQGFRIVSYAWDLDGDGQFNDANQARVTRAVVGLPGDDGVIRVRASLRVTDASGRTNTTSVEVIIDVQNLRPVANAGGPYTTGRLGNSFAPVRLDGRGSSDPNAPCDEIAVYKWDTDHDGRFGADDNPPDLEGPVVDLVKANWQVNTVDTVDLIVCDARGLCSNPSQAEINIREEAPPAGEIVSPRAAQDVCIGAGNFDLVLRISDPEGDPVTATVTIGGVAAGQRANIATNANGTPVEVTIPVNANLIPQGRHEIQVRLQDNNNGVANIGSGGSLVFDRTGPVVQIGAQPGEGVCYNPNQVPQANIQVNDALDPQASFHQEVVSDGCGRTLRVTAEDACGNTTVAERRYLLAEPVSVEFEGVENNALVAEARVGWDVVGPDACASNINAIISRNGAAPQPYPENQLVNQPGNYALTVTVANCQGVSRQQILNFSVNAPPVAVPITDGHPNTDPNNALTYLVSEGAGLQLDGSASRPPEQNDQIRAWRWDLDGDGQYDDAQGQLVAFDTSNDGRFENLGLQVEDSLGATHTASFTVIVTDVDPIANPGGPYVVEQGVELVLDGRGSRPGSAADPITRYVWEWDDGTPNSEGANLSQPRHTFARDGVYNVRLTVHDEDSSHSAVVRVEVRDVNPVVDRIDQPEDAIEILPMEFTVHATPGAPADPITRYEWDVNNDNVVDYQGANLSTIRHQFKTAGRHTVVVTVRDGDSRTTQAINVDVREVTLRELTDHLGNESAAALAAFEAQQPYRNVALQIRHTRPLGQFNVANWEARGLWGEDHQRRGNTLIALDNMLSGTHRAQQQGVPFGLEHWAMGRQLVREMTRLEQSILDLDDGPGQDDQSLQRARQYVEALEDRYGANDYEAKMNGQQDIHEIQEMLADAKEAYFWLSDSIDPCSADYNKFNLPDIADPVARARAAIPINDQLNEALAILAADLQDYIAAGAAQNNFGPGRAGVQQMLALLNQIRELAQYRVGTVCLEGERCVTDQEALELELYAVELVKALREVEAAGVWVRNWQQCVMLAVKFRIELSILRVEFVCGRNVPVSQRARAAQRIGLDLVDELKFARAVDYYAEDAQKCLLIETYNQCLVRNLPQENNPFDFPEECQDNQEEQQ